MAHKEQDDYINRIKNKFPNFFKNKKVLGIGTFNVCGTENEYFNETPIFWAMFWQEPVYLSKIKNY